MLPSLISLLFTLFSTAHADYMNEGPWSLEAAWGRQDIQITNPSTNRSVYDGYGGQLTGRYNVLTTEKFNFAVRATFNYAELDNKADTATLHESLKNTSWAPGIEFRLYHLFAGFEYQDNKSTIDLSGTTLHTLHTSFYSPQFFIGFDIPMDWWGFRLYYTRSEGNIPRLDTGLSADSPWKQEQILIAFRLNFGSAPSAGSSPYNYPSYEVERQPVPEASSNNENSRVYRPVRYFPRPSRNLGN